jgi:hypothetical protein
MKKQQMIILSLSAMILVMVTLIVVMVVSNNQPTPAVTENTTSAALTPVPTLPSGIPTATPSPSPITSPGISETTAAPVTATPTPTPPLADGTYEAYITTVSKTSPGAGSQGTVSVRLAPIFTGDEAIAQAKVDGHSEYVEVDENGNEYIPNDFYISDVNNEILKLAVANACSIRVIPDDGLNAESEDGCIEGTLTDLMNNVAERERYTTIQVSGGKVTLVVEFYLP